MDVWILAIAILTMEGVSSKSYGPYATEADCMVDFDRYAAWVGRTETEGEAHFASCEVLYPAYGRFAAEREEEEGV